jgi:dimethylglycine dehydrogenase
LPPEVKISGPRCSFTTAARRAEASVHRAEDRFGEADPFQNETVYWKDKSVGRITTASYGHLVGSVLAHAYVDLPHNAEGTTLHVAVLGERRPAQVIAPSPLDPGNTRPRQ